MKLRQLDYKKQSLTKNNNEWSVDALLLMDTNLIVGQNARGKSRVLRLIDKVASIINGLPVDDSFNGPVSNTFWQFEIFSTIAYFNTPCKKQSICFVVGNRGSQALRVAAQLSITTLFGAKSGLSKRHSVAKCP